MSWDLAHKLLPGIRRSPPIRRRPVRIAKVAMVSASLILLVGLIGMVLDRPWLYPSLGPTAYLLVQDAHQRTASFHNTVFGHLSALGSGIAAALLFGLQHSPGIFAPGGHLTIGRVEAAGLALALTLLVSALLDAMHPPAGSTAMIVVLGGFRVSFPEVIAVSGGIVAIASFGELLRRTHLIEEVMQTTSENDASRGKGGA